MTREGHRQSGENWNRFKGDVGEIFWETGWSACGLFRAHRHHLEMSGTKLYNFRVCSMRQASWDLCRCSVQIVLPSLSSFVTNDRSRIELHLKISTGHFNPFTVSNFASLVQCPSRNSPGKGSAVRNSCFWEASRKSPRFLSMQNDHRNDWQMSH